MSRTITNQPAVLFAERIVADDASPRDVMVERVPVPSGTLILTLDENPRAARPPATGLDAAAADVITLDPADDTLSPDARLLAQDISVLVKQALREGGTILLLCCPEHDESVAEAVSRGFRVYALHAIHAPHTLYGLPGRARKILRAADGVIVAFACDADEAPYLRDTLKDLPALPALATIT